MSLESATGESRPSLGVAELSRVFAAFLMLGSLAAWWTFAHGFTYYYGDAEAHLNIARRIVDTRTPGGYQIGTVWLPLPHLLWSVFAASDRLWQNGLAGVIPTVVCFALACAFLYAGAHRIYASRAAAWTVAGLFALNPNMLYLQSTAMTEAIMAAGVAGLLVMSLWFRDSQSLGALLAAGVASNAASLTRYEGWFLIPFVALYFLWIADKKWHAVLFGAVAALGPVAWLAHNQFYYSNALEFFNGPYSAIAIYQRQVAAGMLPHPGNGDLLIAARQYSAAAIEVVGWPLLLVGLAGLIVAFATAKSRGRLGWPLFLLALPACFYVWSIRSSATPIFVPSFPPFSLYNTRYTIPVLLLTSFAAGAVTQWLENRRFLRWSPPLTGLLIVAIVTGATAIQTLSGKTLSICWEEARANSAGRRAWIRQTVEAMRGYRNGDGVVFSFGDMAGVMRSARIPFRQGLYQDNGVAWDAAMARPEILAYERWALATEGDPVDQAVQRAVQAGARYRLRQQIRIPGESVVNVYHQE